MPDTERFDREEFRWWLAVQDPEDKVFDGPAPEMPGFHDCPLMAWQRAIGTPCEVNGYQWTFFEQPREYRAWRALPEWASTFAHHADRAGWSQLTVKDALTILDGIDA